MADWQNWAPWWIVFVAVFAVAASMWPHARQSWLAHRHQAEIVAAIKAACREGREPEAILLAALAELKRERKRINLWPIVMVLTILAISFGLAAAHYSAEPGRGEAFTAVAVTIGLAAAGALTFKFFQRVANRNRRDR